MKIEFGLFSTKNTEEEDVGCDACNAGMETCTRQIKVGQHCWMDTKTNSVLCDSCGRVIRYERKKEDKRGGKEPRLIKGLDY